MKKLVVVIFVFCSTAAFGQQNILKVLDTPSANGAKVVVNNNVNVNLEAGPDSDIRSYRIRLYFDNSQDARSLAYGTMSRFESMCPDIPVKVEYKAPNFIVTAGYFLTHIEATAFLSKIQSQFPNAFIIPVDVPISTFGKSTFNRNIVVKEIAVEE